MSKINSYFLFCLLSIVIFSNSLFAQDDKETHIGFKGGISIPKLSGSDNNELSRDYKSRVAPNFGVFFEFDVAKKPPCNLK